MYATCFAVQCVVPSQAAGLLCGYYADGQQSRTRLDNPKMLGDSGNPIYGWVDLMPIIFATAKLLVSPWAYVVLTNSEIGIKLSSLDHWPIGSFNSFNNFAPALPYIRDFYSRYCPRRWISLYWYEAFWSLNVVAYSICIKLPMWLLFHLSPFNAPCISLSFRVWSLEVEIYDRYNNPLCLSRRLCIGDLLSMVGFTLAICKYSRASRASGISKRSRGVRAQG